MSLQDSDTTDGGAIDLEKKRGLNPWMIVGIVFVVAAFVFGWRKVAKKNDASDWSDADGGTSN